jgi:hypothetical protein
VELGIVAAPTVLRRRPDAPAVLQSAKSSPGSGAPCSSSAAAADAPGCVVAGAAARGKCAARVSVSTASTSKHTVPAAQQQQHHQGGAGVKHHMHICQGLTQRVPCKHSVAPSPIWHGAAAWC